MASKKTLNAKNLEALGAERLAKLLIEISTANAAVKRRLRLELAGAQSPIEVAKELRKRLTTIERSRSFIDWQNQKTLIEDLETQHRAIVDLVAKADLAELGYCLIEGLLECVVALTPVEIGRNQRVDVGIDTEMSGRIETGPERED